MRINWHFFCFLLLFGIRTATAFKTKDSSESRIYSSQKTSMLTDNDILRMILGFKVRYLRHQHGLSYHDLSAQTGLSKSYLNDIEKGKKYPKPDKVQALAQAFDIDYNDLVSTTASKKLQPVLDLLNSNFFKLFPMEAFGIDTEKLIDVLSNAPDKVNAFISTILKMTRSYQIDQEDFYRIALRSYQDMHDNHFPLLEQSAREFCHSNDLTSPRVKSKQLESILKKEYLISVNRTTLSAKPKLASFRSFFSQSKSTLFLNAGLTSAQENFLLAKEIGFQHLQLLERPYETQLDKEASFENLLSNFKASYFAAAILMQEQEVIHDVHELSKETKWNPKLLFRPLKKYDVTPEMYFQRLTNVLPQHFGINDIFFLRMQSAEGLQTYKMTKELHLSQLHSPYKNELEEHFCHRWVSIHVLKKIRSQTKSKKTDTLIADAQISKYWKTSNEYFCMSIAQKNSFNNDTPSSVTLGLMLTPQLRATFNFLKDENILSRYVNTTCERCSMPDCDHRVAPPTFIEADELEQELMEELKLLDK